MTCEDCFHNKACNTVFEVLRFKGFGDVRSIDQICPDFADKSRFVEVVRCKDCKHCSKYAFGISYTQTLACVDVDENGVVKFAVATTPDHFCAKRERK